jgi:hypothetical protein
LIQDPWKTTTVSYSRQKQSIPLCVRINITRLHQTPPPPE